MALLLVTSTCPGLVAQEGNATQRQLTGPVRLIFDTDISGDVDDALALAMLHTLQDRGACELLAVTISKVNPLTGPFTDAVNTFYGRPNIPIGVTRQAQIRDSRYLKVCQQQDGDHPMYPHDLTDNQEAPDAVTLLRKTLAAQPDHSVVIVSVGIAVNMARLIESEPDQYSTLNGVQLIERKVKLLSIMAGAFQTIGNDTRHREANVYNDIPSMQKLAASWPDAIPVVWSGFEIGIAAAYPRESIANDFGWTRNHIIKEAYLAHSGSNHDRPTWDLTSVLYAVYPDRGYFDLSGPGEVLIHDDATSQFVPAKPEKKKNSRYLIMNPVQAARVTEALVQLVSAPPLGR
ncbi:MAG: nucleoside hydrolase [Planctomycetaceae bacterium]|nr:nucleoside hydrolase [Planctomycetaceae bacterium]